MKQAFDVAVVGGGLAGLATAAYLGQNGLKSVVIERSSALGGRARTTVEAGASLNLGPHAIYRKGPAWAVLKELSVPLRGGVPKTSGGLALAKSGVHALPVGLVSLLSTGLLSLTGKLEISRVLASLDRIDAESLAAVSALDWIESVARSEAARDFLKGFFRLTTYAGDLSRLSAGASIAQLRSVAKHNVFYLDGGWQSLVTSLRERAESAGATVLAGAPVALVERCGPQEIRVSLRDGTSLSARAVVLATGPNAAAAMTPSSAALAGFAKQATPVVVASLDLVLARLPRPRAVFALGTSEPTYFSVHSAVAALCPPGHSVVHVMSYAPDPDAEVTERALERVMERVQPGYHDAVIHRRFLPRMVASNDLVAADRGGLAGRPDVAVPDEEGVFIAGDWVGREGMLLDASLASARLAASACAEHLSRRADVAPDKSSLAARPGAAVSSQGAAAPSLS